MLANNQEYTQPFTTRRILIVDDEPTISMLLSLIFPDDEVIAISNGAEAMALLAQDSNFDAILCDLNMPGFDGVDVWSGIPEDSPLRERFVFISGGVYSQRMKSFLQDSNVTVLSKPFELRYLRQLINNMCQY